MLRSVRMLQLACNILESCLFYTHINFSHKCSTAREINVAHAHRIPLTLEFRELVKFKRRQRYSAA